MSFLTKVSQLFSITEESDRKRTIRLEGTSLLSDQASGHSVLCLRCGPTNLLLRAISVTGIHSKLNLDLPKEPDNQVISARLLRIDQDNLLVGLLTASGSFIELDLSTYFINGALPEVISGSGSGISQDKSNGVQKKISLYDLSTKPSPIAGRQINNKTSAGTGSSTSGLALDKVLAAAIVFLDLNLELICRPVGFSRGVSGANVSIRPPIEIEAATSAAAEGNLNLTFCHICCTNGYLAFASGVAKPSKRRGSASSASGGKAAGAATSSGARGSRRGSQAHSEVHKDDHDNSGKDRYYKNNSCSSEDVSVSLIKCCNEDIADALCVPVHPSSSDHLSSSHHPTGTAGSPTSRLHENDKNNSAESTGNTEHAGAILYLQTHSGVYLYLPSNGKSEIRSNIVLDNNKSQSLLGNSNRVVDAIRMSEYARIIKELTVEECVSEIANHSNEEKISEEEEEDDEEEEHDPFTDTIQADDESDDLAIMTAAAVVSVVTSVPDANNNEATSATNDSGSSNNNKEEDGDIWRECASDEEDSSSEGEKTSKNINNKKSHNTSGRVNITSVPDRVDGGDTAASAGSIPSATASKAMSGLKGKTTAKVQIRAAEEGSVAFLLVPQTSSIAATAGIHARPWLSGSSKFTQKGKPGVGMPEMSFKPVPISLQSCAKLLGRPSQAVRILNEDEVHKLRNHSDDHNNSHSHNNHDVDDAGVTAAAAAAGVLDGSAGLLYIYLISLEDTSNDDTSTGAGSGTGSSYHRSHEHNHSQPVPRSASSDIPQSVIPTPQLHKPPLAQQLRYRYSAVPPVPVAGQAGQHKEGLYAAAPEPRLVAPCCVVDLRWLLQLEGPTVGSSMPMTTIEVVDQVLIMSESLLIATSHKPLKSPPSSEPSSSLLSSSKSNTRESVLKGGLGDGLDSFDGNIDGYGNGNDAAVVEVQSNAKLVVCSLDGLNVLQRCQLSPGETAIEAFDSILQQYTGVSQTDKGQEEEDVKIEEKKREKKEKETKRETPSRSSASESPITTTTTNSDDKCKRSCTDNNHHHVNEAYIATNHGSVYQLLEYRSSIPPLYELSPGAPPPDAYSGVEAKTDSASISITTSTSSAGTLSLVESLYDRRVSSDILEALTSPTSPLQFLDKASYTFLTAAAQSSSLLSSTIRTRGRRSSAAFANAKCKFEPQLNSTFTSPRSHSSNAAVAAVSLPLISTLKKKTPEKTSNQSTSVPGGDGSKPSASSSVVAKQPTDNNKRRNSAVYPSGNSTASLPPSHQHQHHEASAGGVGRKVSVTRPSLPVQVSGDLTAADTSRSFSKSLGECVSASVLACLSNRDKIDLLLANRDIMLSSMSVLWDALPLLTAEDYLYACQKLAAAIILTDSIPTAAADNIDIAAVAGAVIITFLHKMLESVHVYIDEADNNLTSTDFSVAADRLSELITTILQLPLPLPVPRAPTEAVHTKTTTTVRSLQQDSSLSSILHTISSSSTSISIPPPQISLGTCSDWVSSTGAEELNRVGALVVQCRSVLTEVLQYLSSSREYSQECSEEEEEYSSMRQRRASVLLQELVAYCADINSTHGASMVLVHGFQCLGGIQQGGSSSVSMVYEQLVPLLVSVALQKKTLLSKCCCCVLSDNNTETTTSTTAATRRHDIDIVAEDDLWSVIANVILLLPEPDLDRSSGGEYKDDKGRSAAVAALAHVIYAWSHSLELSLSSFEQRSTAALINNSPSTATTTVAAAARTLTKLLKELFFTPNALYDEEGAGSGYSCRRNQQQQQQQIIKSLNFSGRFLMQLVRRIAS